MEHRENLTWNGRYAYDTIDVDLDVDGGLWVFPNDVIRSPWVQAAFRVSDYRPSSSPSPIQIGDIQATIAYVESAAFRWPTRLEIE